MEQLLTNKQKTEPEKAVPNNLANPFPGLRPFGINESHLFFGREGQSSEVLDKLGNNRFCAVMGASGSGKSSLIYCGLIPVLYGGFIAQAGSRWKLIVFRPGSRPIDNLAEALVKTEGVDDTHPEWIIKKGLYAAMLRRNSGGLTEALTRLSGNEKSNLLILADQFEELFRYRLGNHTPEQASEAALFVKLLVNVVEQTQLPVYTVLTMRSDFIGECAQYQELTTLINRSNYLIPQMTRDNFRDAINGPVAVGGAKLEPALLQQLLNDVGDNPDQLPILQHAMMRTWNYWLNNSDTLKPIGIAEYEATGGMERALSDHANEAFDELNESGKRVCEVLFKTITEKGSDNRGVRRPTRLSEIAEIACVPETELIVVIEKFRQPGRSFITPPYEVALQSQSVVDLSHESLMRIWNRLRTWVEEESAAVQMYQRLSDAASLYQEGKTGLWRPPDLQIALNWEQKQQPTLTWAQRINPAFERTLVFLHTSSEEYTAEEQNKLRQQKRSLQRTRIFSIVLGTAAIVALGLFFWAQAQRVRADSESKKATVQSHIASAQKSIAERKSKEALEQKLIAETKSQEAIKQKEAADLQKIIAERNAKEALKQKQLADKNSAEANEQRKLAEKNATEAIQQKSAAEKAREEAFKRRMLAISQSAGVKSQQIDEDIDLKALLAWKSYEFNARYQGPVHNADVFAGLYLAYNVQNKKGFNVFKAHTDAVNAIVFEPSSNVFYTAGSDGRILRWNLNDTLKKTSKVVESKFLNKCLAISPDGQWLASGTLGNGFNIIDIDKNYELRNFKDKGLNIAALSFTNDSKGLYVAIENNVLYFDLISAGSTVIATATAQILAMSLNPNNSILAVSTKDGKVIAYEPNHNYNPTIIVDDSRNQFSSLAFNHKGNYLAIGGIQGYLRIWDASEVKVIASVRNHLARITDIKFSPDDKNIVTSSYDATVQIWDAQNFNAQPIRLRDHDSWVLSLAFNSRGDRLVSGSIREDRLVVHPVNVDELAQKVQVKINRSFTKEEWNTYIASDVPYEDLK